MHLVATSFYQYGCCCNCSAFFDKNSLSFPPFCCYLAVLPLILFFFTFWFSILRALFGFEASFSLLTFVLLHFCFELFSLSLSLFWFGTHTFFVVPPAPAPSFLFLFLPPCLRGSRVVLFAFRPRHLLRLDAPLFPSPVPRPLLSPFFLACFRSE